MFLRMSCFVGHRPVIYLRVNQTRVSFLIWIGCKCHSLLPSSQPSHATLPASRTHLNGRKSLTKTPLGGFTHCIHNSKSVYNFSLVRWQLSSVSCTPPTPECTENQLNSLKQCRLSVCLYSCNIDKQIPPGRHGIYLAYRSFLNSWLVYTEFFSHSSKINIYV